MNPVECVALHGRANAGVRARMAAFLERLDAPHRLTSYFPGNAAGARQFARHPLRAAVSEVRLRKLTAARPSRVVLYREASPLSRGRVETDLLRAAEHGVYDIDDALHLDVRGALFERLFSKAAKATRAVRAADVVIVGNDVLAEWAAPLARDVRVVPTCVDPADYRAKVDYTLADPPRLLWLGTPSGEPYLGELAPALWRLHRDLGARLVIIGSDRPSLGSLEQIITRVPWTLDGARQGIADHDVGLMPLRDAPYERGKCAYKLLEYGAAGLPVVASPIGVNARILAASDAPSPRGVDEWYEAVRALLEAPAGTRERQARLLRAVVDREFTFERWLPTWSAVVGIGDDRQDRGAG